MKFLDTQKRINILQHLVAAVFIILILVACSTNSAPRSKDVEQIEETLAASTQSNDVTYGTPKLVIRNFGQDAGNWRVAKHVRVMADVSGDNKADIVGFGDNGVLVSVA